MAADVQVGKWYEVIDWTRVNIGKMTNMSFGVGFTQLDYNYIEVRQFVTSLSSLGWV